MSKIDLHRLEKVLSYQFNHPSLLHEALTHKSFVNESVVRGLKDNERLEYLGDAVLDLVVSEYLFDQLKEAREGELSKLKSMIVNESALATIAKNLNLGEFISLGKGEELTHGREKTSLLANTLEALIAAIYLDSGLIQAKVFIDRWFKETARDILSHRISFDYKTDFQEQCQKYFEILPEYRLIKTSGPDHKKIFEIHVIINGEIFGSGVGKNKKEAEQKAAKEALTRLKEMKERSSQ